MSKQQQPCSIHAVHCNSHIPLSPNYSFLHSSYAIKYVKSVPTVILQTADLTIWKRDVDPFLKPPSESLIDVPWVVGGSQNHYDFVFMAVIQKVTGSTELNTSHS
jgi:hypothetical protein